MRILLWAFAVVVCVFLVAPVFIVFPLAFSTSEFLMFPPPGYSTQWFSAFLSDASWTRALVRSLWVGAGATAFAVVLGTAAAYALSRASRSIAATIQPVLMLPIIVPTVVFGAGAYLLLTRLNLSGDFWPVVLAHGLLALPFALTMVGAALRITDPAYELAAQNLGAPPWRAYATVTFKLTLPAIIISAVLAFVTSLDEVVVALFLSPDKSPTLPVRMYSSIRYELDPLVPVASTIVVAITFFAGAICALALRTFARIGG